MLCNSDIYFSLERLYLLIITLIVVMLVLCRCCTWSQRTFLMEKRKVSSDRPVRRNSGAAPHIAVGVVSGTLGEHPVVPLEADL